MASAVESLAKYEAIGIDTTRVLIDRSSESGLETDAGRLQQCRHMLSNASMSMPARIANGSNTWKGCFGSSAFGLSTFFQGVSCGFVEDCYQLTIDDKPVAQGGVSTTLMQVSNGKYSNGGMIMNQFASVNDGLIDITWISDPAWMSTYSTSGIMSDARSGGGIQAYQGHSTYLRGRKIRIDIPEPAVQQPELELGEDATPAEKPL